MSRLDNVIEQVKAVRRIDKNHRAWIFDDNGNIKDNVICGDVLPLLEELKEYEINVSDEWIEKFREESDGDNTYNWGANICNDLNMNYNKKSGIFLFMVHLYGDIRGGYSDYFAVKFDRFDDLYYLESITQMKDINDRYVADINLFRECYDVYDTETQDSVGEFFTLEVEDLLKELEVA